MLQQQQDQLVAVRAELEEARTALHREQDDRKSAERKAEQATLQLSVERSAHQKLQRQFEHERATAAVARARRGSTVAGSVQSDDRAVAEAEMQVRTGVAHDAEGYHEGSASLAAFAHAGRAALS